MPRQLAGPTPVKPAAPCTSQPHTTTPRHHLLHPCPPEPTTTPPAALWRDTQPSPPLRPSPPGPHPSQPSSPATHPAAPPCPICCPQSPPTPQQTPCQPSTTLTQLHTIRGRAGKTTKTLVSSSARHAPPYRALQPPAAAPAPTAAPAGAQLPPSPSALLLAPQPAGPNHPCHTTPREERPFQGNTLRASAQDKAEELLPAVRRASVLLAARRRLRTSPAPPLPPRVARWVAALAAG